MDRHQNWLGFPYDSTFVRSHDLHPHPHPPAMPERRAQRPGTGHRRRSNCEAASAGGDAHPSNEGAHDTFKFEFEFEFEFEFKIQI
eukprot:COSAG01_NODE_10630_length_2116_cov_17.950421_3_plen_86_part_00